ncbi:MAG TPA: hypothetical protein VHY08_08910 [Bacillota bacterium]|nr:hypothetical protein [Bacillota bacterium]
MRRNLLFIMLLLFILGFTMITYAEEPSQEIILQPVNKDTPEFSRSKETEQGLKYDLRMVKIENNEQIKKPPVTDAKILYYGKVKLGNPALEYGILVDFEGAQKILWVDADADLDYSEETPLEIFKSDRYPGVNVYYSPAPLTFQIMYRFDINEYRVPLLFDLPYLVVARIGSTDIFYLKTRTWFSGTLSDNGEDLNIAVVDTNDNGIYNDPEDLIFVDHDFDLKYSPKEGTPIKKMKKIKLKSKKRFEFDYQYCPQKLLLK